MQHLQANPRIDHNGQLVNENDREEMCRATIAAQVSDILNYLKFKGTDMGYSIEKT